MGLIVYVASPLSVQAATPGISISPITGVPGTQVTVTGSGFVGNETGITVTYDGTTTVATGITANSGGGWSATFAVPASASGSHVIGAYGSATTAASVPTTTFTVTSAISISPSSGAAGSPLTVTGSGFGASETGITVTYDGTTVALGIIATSQGAWSVAFVVPASASGPHSIDASGSVTTSVPAMTFIVIPGISISPSRGAAGSSLTVTGSGFGPSETGITVTYDGIPVAQSIIANSRGGWSATFEIPASTSGSHSIGAYGSVTPAASVPYITFTVTPGISLSRSIGAAGSPLTVTGSSFGASETGITVTYDGTPVAQSIIANSQGGWSATFVVPASGSGSHIIAAYGSITPAASVPNMTFAVTSGVSISRSSGATGSSVTVTGSGFGPSEAGITVTYDGTPVARGITANFQGAWSATFEIPASTSGSHSIGASGSLTQATSATEVGFTVVPAISVSDDYGYVGETVDVTGSGFAANAPLTFSYDNQEINAQGGSTDSSGSFSESITIPQSVHGTHTIKVADDQNNNAKVTFTIQSTPPPIPRLLSPGDGSRVGLLGGIKPTMKWTGVTDPSGVTYTLEVDTSPDFSQPILQQTDITGTSYTLTSAQALPKGEYYWRVEAVDGASNESGWTQPWLLKSGLMASWTLAIIIILALAAIGAMAYFLVVRLRRRRGQFIPVPAVDISDITPERLRLPQQAPVAIKDQGTPRRLALPQPTKRGKMLSGEELARLKVILDFAQSLPLAEPGYTVNWLVDLLQSSTGLEVSPAVYQQLLEGEVQVHYEPTWMRHPTYQELTTLLRGQPILQDLNAFVDLVDRCASEATLLLQEIHRDAIAEIPSDFLAKGGWGFVSAIYSDALSWFQGKSLRDPAERDYTLKPGEEGRTLWLWGEDNTSFAAPLIQVLNENEASAARALHLKLRRTYRNSDRARQLVSMMTEVEVQGNRLVNAFSQAFSQLARSTR